MSSRLRTIEAAAAAASACHFHAAAARRATPQLNTGGDPYTMAPERSPLEKLIAGAHDPGLAEREGLVEQIWNDGEITSQKGGELLWRRTLHTIEPPLRGVSVAMPVAHGRGMSYAFVTPENARAIRALMAQSAAG